MTKPRCLLATSTLLLLLAGCGAGPPPEPTSTASLALAAAGPDGHTYRLPITSFFHVHSGATLVNSLFTGGSEPNMVFTLPVGSYVGRERDTGAAGDPNGVNWQLIRVKADGSTSLVPATLHDPEVRFDIMAGVTTPIVLRFTVHDVGDVVFVTGRGNLSVMVAQETVPAGAAKIAGGLAVTAQMLAGTSGLNAALTAPAGTRATIALTVKLAGGWTHRITQVCQPVSDVAVTAASDHAGLAAWLSELTGATGTSVCFVEGSDLVLVNLARNGTANSALGAHLSGPQLFALNLRGTAPAGTWDGSTLQLARLAQPAALTAATASLEIRPGAPSFPVTAQTSLDATVTLQFVP